jgi:cation diffusion facilitator family transporter
VIAVTYFSVFIPFFLANIWVTANDTIMFACSVASIEMKTTPVESARPFALLSIGAAVMTISLKFGAYRLTGSVGLLSDALESLVNLVAAVTALWAIDFAAKPPDAHHDFGYSKAEYFSSALEGVLILFAAASIIVTAIDRLLHPQLVEQVGWGLIISIVAAGINGIVAVILLRAGNRLRSIALQADGKHLLTDVWTSAGVVVGLLAVQVTGWLPLDPLVAIGVAINILWAGFRLLQETGSGLLDAALSSEDLATIQAVLAEHQKKGIQFHALRTRLAGARRFVTIHVLVPGSWSVQEGHDLCDRIEIDIAQALPGTHTLTHLEPSEDPVSWQDQELDRPVPAPDRPRS